jgi:hypothetical protein
VAAVDVLRTYRIAVLKVAAIAAERGVRHLERAGFVVMKKPPLGGHPVLRRGSER